MNPQDTTLARTLYDNGLLCPTSTRKGDPLRIRLSPAGDISIEEGPPTVWHRFR